MFLWNDKSCLSLSSRKEMSHLRLASTIKNQSYRRPAISEDRSDKKRIHLIPNLPRIATKQAMNPMDFETNSGEITVRLKENLNV